MNQGRFGSRAGINWLAVGLAAAAVYWIPAGHTQHLLLFGLLWLLPTVGWAPFMPGPRYQRRLSAAALVLLLNPLVTLLLVYVPGAPGRLLLLGGACAVAVLPLLLPARLQAAPVREASIDRRAVTLLAGVLLAALLLRVVQVDYKEFQGDEGVVLARAAAALTGDDEALFRHQKGPLEILIPLETWGISGALTELYARLPFTYAAVLGVAAVMALAAWWTRRWVRGQTAVALLAGAFLAVAGLGVAFGRIVQYQSFVVLWGTLAVLHAARYRDDGARRDLLLAASFLGGGLLAHYDAILVAPAVAWLLLPTVRRRPWAWAGALLLGASVLGLFYVPFVLQPSFADTVGYLLNDRVGAGGDGGVFRWTVPRVWEMGIFYNGIYYVAGLLLLSIPALALAVRRGALRLPAAAWLHLLAPLFFYALVVADPRTHVYTILPGLVVIAATGAVSLWLGVKQPPIRQAIGAGVSIIVLLSAIYALLMFVQTNPERQRTWAENRPAGFPTPFDEPPLYGRFGFPYQAGWRVAADLLPPAATWYGSNEEEEVTAWYMAQRPRTFCDNEEVFLLARNVQDEVPFDPDHLATLAVERQITVAGRRTLTLYAAQARGDGAPVEAGGRRLWRTPQEVVAPRRTGAHELQIVFNDQARLLGYDLDAENAMAGGQIVVTLYWEVLAPFERNFQSFVHVYDGTRWAQHDGAPACAQRPTSGWEPGQIIIDPHLIELPAEIPAGSFPLYAGMYDLLTAERLPVPGHPDNWVRLGTVDIAVR